MSHTVKTEKFEGPISTLYRMIEEKQMSVSEISLVSIVEDFLNYVKSLSEINKEDATQFVTIAAVLILLKSKSLLPDLELSEEETRDILVLENQLKAFEILKERSRLLGKLWQKKIIPDAKIKQAELKGIFVPDKKMDLKYFNEYILERLKEITPTEEEKKEVKVHKTIKIEDALSHVRNVIRKIKNLNFKNLNVGGDERLKEKNKKTVVILFLAVLELVKMGEIDATQDGNFSDILVVENVAQ